MCDMMIESAREAMRLGKEVMEEAGYSYSTITKAEPEDGKWIVGAKTIATEFVMEIDAETEEVLRYERVGEA